MIPPIEVPADTAYVKRFKFQSPMLTKFWGRPIYLGAVVLLPRDYERQTMQLSGELHPGPLLARRAVRLRRDRTSSRRRG